MESSPPTQSQSAAPGTPEDLLGVHGSSAGALRTFWRVVAGCVLAWLAWTFVFPADPIGGGADEPWRSASTHTWGWDESMHAELPAVQMLLHARQGEWIEASEVVHECDRYPFLYPAALAGWQAVFGIGEAQARALGQVTYGLLVLLAIRLALLVVRPLRRAGNGLALDVGLLVGLAALSSPLARRYAPTLFLEIPALTMIAATLWAWIARREAELGTTPRRRRDLLAGACVIATFFTKFNYALLVALALGLDALFEIGFEVGLGGRKGRVKEAVRSLLWVALPVALGLAWWFLLPLPLGQDVAQEHRADFLEFVTGNLEMQMAMWLRLTNWLTGIAAHSFVFAALVVLSLALGLFARNRSTLTLSLALFAFVVPIVRHPFQLDRFLLPAALALWVMGGCAAACLLMRSPRWFSAAAVLVGGASFAVPVFQTTGWVGFPIQPEGTPNRRFQEYHVGTTLSVLGPPASNGLTRDVYVELMDMVADAVGPDDSVGWLGQSAEVSPAALHLGLLERGGSAARFLEYAEGPMDIELLPSNVRVDYTDDEVIAYARQFDHVIIPTQGDLVERGGRSWIPGAWHGPLRREPLITWRTLGSILVDRSNRGPFPVTIELASTAELKD